MRFIKFINNKKLTLLTIFLFIYAILNLLDGERGLISYIEKKKIKEQLLKEKQSKITKLAKLEKKNSLLNENIDLDYLEILFRKKFMYGKTNEKIYINE